MILTRRTVGLAVLAALLSGCATRGGRIPYDVPNFDAPDQTTSVAIEDSIAPLDKLAVRVFGFNDLSGEYDVDLAGNIDLPLIGQVKAVNLSTGELKRVLTQRYGDRYLQSPDVSVGIKSSTKRVITVDGAILAPGQYPVTGTSSLMQVIALSRGVSPDANPRRVAVFRTIRGERKAAAFDLTSIRKGEAPDPTLYAGDIVVVDGSKVQEAYKTAVQSLSVFGLLNTFLPIF